MSISNYVKKKLNEDQNFDPLNTAAEYTAIGVGGLIGIKMAYSLIQPVIQKWSWKHKGCHNIIDPYKQQMCNNYIKKGIINDLLQQKGKCKDKECSQKIDEELNKYKNNF